MVRATEEIFSDTSDVYETTMGAQLPLFIKQIEIMKLLFLILAKLLYQVKHSTSICKSFF